MAVPFCFQVTVHVGLSGTEGESEAKSSDGMSLTTRVTTAMIWHGAFLEVHVEEDMFAEFGHGDMDSIEDVGDESVQQEGPLGEGLVEAEVEEEPLVADRETLMTGTQATWAAMMLNHSLGTLWILENLNHENLFY